MEMRKKTWERKEIVTVALGSWSMELGEVNMCL